MAKGKSKQARKPKKTSKSGIKEAKLKFKSPAEFFAENQNIAGFDNAGKALYTTVRELVENSLDAAESIRVLPKINLKITELSSKSFTDLQGLSVNDRVDKALYANKNSKGKKGKSANGGKDNDEEQSNVKSKSGTFFKMTCTDNGCGMQHDKVPDMFGRVLAGSKYGVKQARGKFGLGAKMALIWSKKSTGLPIEIRTSHTTDPNKPSSFVTHCKLDIDIHKNQPNIRVHEKLPNDENWHGSQVELVISGNWRSYKSRVMNYLEMLAVITPYAEFTFEYECEDNPKKSFTMSYKRRSEQMCKPAKQVKHHPKSVDNLIVRQLLNDTKRKHLEQFLTTDLSGINKPLAKRLVEELVKLTDENFDPKTKCADIGTQTLQQLTQMLRDTTQFAPPDSKCLSPAGEYNLRLGIMKEYKPDLVATATAKPGAYNGHPFLVEAAVAIGGKASKPGLNIYRFANRIPLLFEPGNDVVNVVANKRVKWSSYKINHKVDKIGVFVSIVSTKIPFKGTGKEYIGDDITELADAVKSAIGKCCTQLKSKLAARRQERDHEARAKNLAKYVPDASRALYGILAAMKENYVQEGSKRRRVEGSTDVDEYDKTLRKLDSGEITQAKISAKLIQAIETADHAIMLEAAAKRGRGQADRCEVHFIPSIPSQDGEPKSVLFQGLSAGSVGATEIVPHPVLGLKLIKICQLRK